MEVRGADTLVSAARGGDQLAWARLFELHARRLAVWLGWLPMSDAASSPEDIASQAWLTAASKMHDFRGSDEDFAGWLFSIARRHALNDYRKGVRRRTRPAELDPSADTLFTAANDDVGRVDDHDVTCRLLAQLSPREAEVIACVDIVGLDVRSTATALGMKPTAVRVARHRALARLRLLWDEQMGDSRPRAQPREVPG